MLRIPYVRNHLQAVHYIICIILLFLSPATSMCRVALSFCWTLCCPLPTCPFHIICNEHIFIYLSNNRIVRFYMQVTLGHKILKYKYMWILNYASTPNCIIFFALKYLKHFSSHICITFTLFCYCSFTITKYLLCDRIYSLWGGLSLCWLVFSVISLLSQMHSIRVSAGVDVFFMCSKFCIMLYNNAEKKPKTVRLKARFSD
jgi:hypothetical protein